jgi:putative transposase
MNDQSLPQLLTFFHTIIKYQNDVIRMLLTLLVGKGMFQTPDEKPVSMPYRKLQVDDLSLIERPEKLDYLQLLAEHLRTTGKPLKPVKRHQGSTLVPANNGDQGQFLCKVCDCLFSTKNRYLRDAVLKCPHCAKTLESIKERKDFDIFKCKQDHCPFYLGKLR